MIQLCRACLVAKESFNYMLFENISADVYAFCTSVQVSRDDELPKTVCNTCNELLEKYSDFKRTCIQSQNTLVFQNKLRDSQEETNVKCEIDSNCEVLVNEVDNPGTNGENYCNSEDDLNNDSIKGDEEYHEKPKKAIISKRKVQKLKIKKEFKNNDKKKTKVFEYVCEICKSKFKYKERYEVHKLEHQGQTVTKTCGICKKTFMTWSGLQRHRDSEHRVVKMNTLRCKDCGKVFKNKQTLKLHSKLHSMPEVHTSVCDICGKSFSSPVTLKLHLESHNQNRARDFPCEHCGKKFFTKYILHSHIKRLHTGQRYICQLCEYPFTDKYNLGKHMLTHQGIKEHKCDICEKFFSTHSTLVIHKRIHSGERPFCCGYCTKAFSSKNRLVVHHRTHTGERPHRCLICNLAFTQLGTMKRHMKTHNKPPTLGLLPN